MTSEPWRPGQRLWFWPGTGPMDGSETIKHKCRFVREVRDYIICVKLLSGTQVCVASYRVSSRERTRDTGRRVREVPNTPTVRELRRTARQLNIEDWEDMSESQLRKAVKEAEGKAAAKASTRSAKSSKAKASTAKASRRSRDTDDDDEDEAPAKSKSKTTAKKATTKKAAASDVEPAENGNPFKPGTNMFLITEELIKGGKRSAMVTRLKKKITLEPRTKSAKDFDVDSEMDRRILIIGQILRNDHGFNVVRDGRGPDATIVAEAP